jgi:alkanesulfonate monooxygenase SsuD/methylene tetrahydromethanopterin reductase-like flavin-dependent oxidoreductase (luciferase family)
MKVDLFLMPTVPATFEERAQLRPVGRNVERYQMMLDEVRDIAVMADEFGIDAFSTTEHHLHTEGGEAMPNPVLLYVDLAARTRNIHFIPMSIVLTATNPIRAAEDIALLDHLTKGRTGVCLARGYQKRWLEILSQGVPTANLSGDEANRQRFNEYAEIMLKSWTEDVFDYNGTFFQIPFPFEEGLAGWGPAEWTRKYGSDGEIDDDGIIRKIGVIPKPYQDPHPPVFVPFTASPATLDFAIEHNFTPFIFASVPEQFNQLCLLVQDKAAGFGNVQGLGQNVGAVRGLAIGDTEEEAFELCASTTGYEFQYYWNYFGFAETFRDPEKDDPNKPVTFKDEYECAQRIIDRRWQLCGTVDQVRRQMHELHSCYGDGALEWFQWNFFYQGTHNRDTQRRQLELFAEKIMPEFR